MAMNPITIAAFFDELEKIAQGCPSNLGMVKVAVTRAQKEWRRAQAAGQQGYADQIANAYGDLGLAPRYLKDVSDGGAEAGVDMMMGAVGGTGTGRDYQGGRKLPGGLIARKLYKPDSLQHRGEYTGKVLAAKQEATDFMRNQTDAAQHVAEMAGYKQVNPGRYVSYHEYVPNMRDATESAEDIQRLQQVVDRAITPASKAGYMIGDAVGPGFQTRGFNKGNVRIAKTPQGEVAKVVDFRVDDIRGENPAGAFVSEMADRYGNGAKASIYPQEMEGVPANLRRLRRDIHAKVTSSAPTPPSSAPPASTPGSVRPPQRSGGSTPQSGFNAPPLPRPAQTHTTTSPVLGKHRGTPLPNPVVTPIPSTPRVISTPVATSLAAAKKSLPSLAKQSSSDEYGGILLRLLGI